MDNLLASDDNFLIGLWMKSAKKLADNRRERKQYEWNARTQITMWFDSTELKQIHLHDYANKYWNETAQIMKDVVIEAIGYCHSKGVMHRDIKLENIFVSPDTVPAIKPGYFGVATYFQKDKPIKGYVGTPSYLAPKMYKQCGYVEGMDIWSSGLVLYKNVMWGGNPFQHKGLWSLQNDILQRDRI
eukprot:Gb_10249 [translate_table: standard]